MRSNPLLLSNLSFCYTLRFQIFTIQQLCLPRKERDWGSLRLSPNSTEAPIMIPLPVLRPNPSSLNHRLPVTIIFQTASPETAETQGVLVNFHVQSHPWRLGRAK